MDGSVVWLARLHVWIATVVTCLTDEENRARHNQNLHDDTPGRMLKLAMDQRIGNIRLFVEYRAGDELVPRNAKVTKVVSLPHNAKEYSVIDSGKFAEYVSKSSLLCEKERKWK